MEIKKKHIFLFILLTIILGASMYYRFSDNNKDSELYNPTVFSFRDKVYQLSDVRPYIRYYQSITGKTDEENAQYALESFIKNEVLFSYINDLKNGSDNKNDFTVSDDELINEIHKNKSFQKNIGNGQTEFDSKLYRDGLSAKGIDVKFFEEQLRKELTLGKFLNHLDQNTKYNDVSKNIALESTLNTRIVDTLKINYDLIPVQISNNELQSYYNSHQNDFRKENSYSVTKYTFNHKGDENKKNDVSFFVDELKKLDGKESVDNFLSNKTYYEANFGSASTNMNLTFSQISKLLNLGALKIENIGDGATFFDDSEENDGIILFYVVNSTTLGENLSFDESKNKIESILKKSKNQEFLYSSYPFITSQDFSKVNEPYLTYERIVINPLSWKGDDDFLSATYQLKKGEAALARNNNQDLFVKLSNIEPATIKDDEKKAFEYSQEQAYKNFILMTFYGKIKAMYDYKENNLLDRAKELK